MIFEKFKELEQKKHYLDLNLYPQVKKYIEGKDCFLYSPFAIQFNNEKTTSTRLCHGGNSKVGRSRQSLNELLINGSTDHNVLVTGINSRLYPFAYFLDLKSFFHQVSFTLESFRFMGTTFPETMAEPEKQRRLFTRCMPFGNSCAPAVCRLTLVFTSKYIKSFCPTYQQQPEDHDSLNCLSNYCQV